LHAKNGLNFWFSEIIEPIVNIP